MEKRDFIILFFVLLIIISGCSIIPIDQTFDNPTCYEQCRPLGNGEEYCEEVCY